MKLFSSGKSDTGPKKEEILQAKKKWSAALQNFSKKLYNRAMLDLKDAIQLNPEFLEEARNQLENYAGSSQEEKAIAMGLVILGFDRKNVQLMNKVGNLYREINQFGRAMKIYRQALKIQPKDNHVKYNLAACTFKIKTANEILVRQTKEMFKFSQYRRFGYQLQYDDKIPKIQNELLETNSPNQEEINNEPIGVEEVEIWIPKFEEKAKSNPKSWKHQFDLAVLYDIGLFGDLAIKYYQQAGVISPENPVIQNNLGVAFDNYKNDFQQARTVLQQILKKHLVQRYIVLNLAILHKKHQKGFSSLKYFTYLGELLSKSHGLFHVDEMIEQADIFYEKGEDQSAENLYKALLEENENPEWYFRLGVIAWKRNEKKYAVEYWHKSVEIEPDYQPAVESLSKHSIAIEEEAHDLIQDNFLADAVPLLEYAISILPKIETCEKLSEIYDILGEKEKADQMALKIMKMS